MLVARVVPNGLSRHEIEVINISIICLTFKKRRKGGGGGLSVVSDHMDDLGRIKFCECGISLRYFTKASSLVEEGLLSFLERSRGAIFPGQDPYQEIGHTHLSLLPSARSFHQTPPPITRTSYICI